MKILTVSAICLILLTGCQLISPILTNYNGVRMDVAHYINNSWRFGLKERDVLVAYAKEQQKVTTWTRLNDTERHRLAEQRLFGRYCAEQKISAKKLDLIDQKIFANSESQMMLVAMYRLQQKMQLDLNNTDCKDKF